MRLSRLLPIVGLIALGAVYYYFYRRGDDAPSYKTAKISRGPIEELVTATGTLSALTTVVVGSQVSGIILKVYVDYNDTVTKGQLLAELDPATLDVQKKEAEAGLATAEAQLARAKAASSGADRELARARDLAAKELIAAAEREAAEAKAETARADLESAKARIKELRAQLELAELALSRTKIYSPINGVVINRKVEPGQTVAASLSAPELFSIAEDLKKMRVIADVDEADVGRLKEGLAATFAVDAFPGERFVGTIIQIRYSPTIQNGVTTYAAVIAVENPELKLRPGMTTNIEIAAVRKEDALLVPNAALRFVPPADSAKRGDKKGEKQAPPAEPPPPGAFAGEVYVRDGEGLRSIPLVLGLSDGKSTEVLRGDISPDQEVVTEMTQQKGRPTGRGPRF
jgi:HlyD family secretion protein